MAFNPELVTALFPGSTNGTNTLVLTTSNAAGDKSLPELTNAECGVVSGGDTRKIIYALMERLHAWFSGLATANKPSKLNVTRSSYIEEDTGNIIRTYTVRITTAATGIEVAEEPVAAPELI